MGSRPRSETVALLVLLVAGLALRAANWPGYHAHVDCDEETYLENGLNLWEGMTPGTKMTPGAPITWVAWGYAAVLSAGHVLAPGPEERAAPLSLRPLVAVDHALFDAYEDLAPLRRLCLFLGLLVSAWGIAAGFRLGAHRAGLWGGVLVGGIAALLPLYVEFAGMARPYVFGWSLGLVALERAATRTGRARWLGAGVLLGLAVASRVEMLTLLPFVLAELWQDPAEERPARAAALAAFSALATAQLVAPWLLLNLLGNVRNVAMVRFLDVSVRVSARAAAEEVGWRQGLAPFLVVLVAGSLLALRGARPARWVLVALTLALAASLLQQTGFGLRHHGATLVVLTAAGALALSAWRSRWPRLLPLLALLCLALPAAQAVLSTAARRAERVPEDATDWVKAHVPAGTVLYLSPTLYDPLPTPEASDRIWREVADPDAWRRKVASASKRLGLPLDEPPRALSEEHMIVDRGHFRRWYILGERPGEGGPRYDVRLFAASGYFGLQLEDVAAAFAKTGGVVIWREAPSAAFGEPVTSWTAPSGKGTYVYCSPDVRPRLKP